MEKQSIFDELQGELKDFYNFHGVQLVNCKFPGNIELLQKLQDKLKNGIFNAGNFLEIVENQQDETFQVVAKQNMEKEGEIFLIDHTISYKYEQLRGILETDPNILARLKYMLKFWDLKRKIPGISEAPPKFDEIVEFDFMDIEDPNIKMVKYSTVALSFYGNLIQDIELVKQMLNKLPDLKVLWLNENPVCNIEDFQSIIENEYPHIQILNSKFTKNVDAWGFKFITYKQNLDLVNLTTDDQIVYLDLSDRNIFQIKDFSIFKNLTNLKEIKLLDHELNDIDSTNKFFEFLNNCTKLENIQVDKQILDILFELQNQNKLSEICPTLRFVNGFDIKLKIPTKQNEDDVKYVMKNIQKVVNCYRIITSEQYDESSVWYVNDELGSSIEHSDFPNFQFSSFLYAPNNVLDQQAISYSICWPTKNIQQGEDIFRDYLLNIDQKQHRSTRLMIWFDIPEKPYYEFYEQNCEKMQKIAIQGQQQLLQWDQDHKEPHKTVSKHLVEKVQNNEKIKVVTDYQLLLDNLNLPIIEFDKSQGQESNIIFLNSALGKQAFEKLNKEQYINQFPYESCIIRKDNLANTIQDNLGFHQMIQPTYFLDTELPIFIGDYLSRKKNGKDNLWIVKPPNLARITDSLDVIMRQMETGPRLIQKYIQNPVTLKGRKIDLRYNIYVKSINPPEIYCANVFWIRTSNNQYTTDYRQREVYETQFTVMNYGTAELKQIHHTEFIKDFNKEYQQYNITWDEIDKQIKLNFSDLFKILAIKYPQMQYEQSRAQYGVDLMVDKTDFQPKILEFTFGPDNTRACKFYPNFYNDMFSLLYFDKKPEDHDFTRII